LDGDVLVVADAPGVGLGEGGGPKFVGRRETHRVGRAGGRFGLHAHEQIDRVDPFTVGGVGEADGEFSGVVLGLGEAERDGFVPGFGLDDGELGVAVFEDVVGLERLGAAAGAFEPAERDEILAADAAAFDDAPTGRAERGVDVLGARLGFVHFKIRAV
jgi:hypothetical protein